MTIEINNNEYKLMKKFELHINKKKGFELKVKYFGEKFCDIYKVTEKKILGFAYNSEEKLTTSLYIYNDWIYIKVESKNLDIIKTLVKNFSSDINIKIEVFGDLGSKK